MFVTEQINAKYKMSKKIHWRQLVLLIEIAILTIVGFMPESLNMAATVMVSFSCSMQVQAFRKVNGFAYASTMCIGNLRSGTDALSVYVRERKREQLVKAFHYFGIIFFFALGSRNWRQSFSKLGCAYDMGIVSYTFYKHGAYVV